MNNNAERNYFLISLICFFVGVGIICISYKIAYTETFPWFLYWVGFFLCAIPVLLISINPNINYKTKCLLLFLYGLVFYLIQYLGSNGYYHFRDEYLLAATTKAIYTYESLNVLDKISMNKIFLNFPGMELLVVELQRILNIDNSYPVVATVIAISHSLILVFVFLFFKVVSNNKLAGIAAFVYSTNIDYSWFNTIFHYESIGILFFMVLLYLFAYRNTKRYKIIQYVILFLIVTVSLTITHHLSSYILLIVILIFSLIQAVIYNNYTNKLKPKSMSFNLTVIVAVIVLSWLIYSATYAINYFNYNIVLAIKQILSFSFLDSVKNNMENTPKWGTGLPFWELLIYKYAYVPALVITYIVGLYALYKEKIDVNITKKTYRIGLIAVGILAIFSIMVSGSGITKATEFARRLLPFLYLGIAFVIASGYLYWRKRTFKIAIFALIAIVIFGGAGIGTTRVRGNDNKGPKYIYLDKNSNLDVVTAKLWLDKQNFLPIATDDVTAEILDLQISNSKIIFNPERANGYFLINKKIQQNNWEPYNKIVFTNGNTKYKLGDPIIPIQIENVKNKTNNIYSNGCVKAVIPYYINNYY